ncbi:MAG: S-layer homology domain-containing protein [Thermostichales cyanobacterium DRC_bins_46]
MGMKLGLGLLGGVVLSVGWATVAVARLTDIGGYWAAPYIQQLADQQILGGFPDGTFRPNDSVTRAQFAAIITRAFGLDTNVPPRQFSDPIPGWAAPAINAAAGAGLISGFPDGTFRPNDNLTRAQAITVLTRAAGVPAIDPNQVETILAIYSDNQSIPNFARPSVAAATQAGLIVLYPNPTLINAARVATRGEVAALTQLALSKAGRLPALAVPPGAVIPGAAPPPPRAAATLPVEPLPAPTPPLEAPATPPKIRDLLTRSDLNALRPGTTLDLILLGTPGSRASFSITGVVEGIPMTETRPGQYEGSYTIRTQDRATAAVIEARLEANGLTTVAQLPQTVRLGIPQDSSFPSISGFTPANQSVVNSRQPQISARFQDEQGIDLNSFNLLINNQNVTNQAQISRQGFSYTPARPLPLNRPVSVRVQIADINGNTSFAEWSFTIVAATPTPAGARQDSPATPTPMPVPPATPTPVPVPPATPTPMPVPPATPTPAGARQDSPAAPPATPTPGEAGQDSPPQEPTPAPPILPDGLQAAPTPTPQ